MVACATLASCNATQCQHIAEWLEYTIFDVPNIETVRLCVANHADHTLQMSAAIACPDGGDMYTCFDACGIDQ